MATPNYFAEKATQVEPSNLQAFGIPVSSRYGNADELTEILQFAQLLAQKGIAHQVLKVFYNSKVGICEFDLDPSVKKGTPVANVILEAARKTVAQFDWFGGIEHGAPMERRMDL